MVALLISVCVESKVYQGLHVSEHTFAILLLIASQKQSCQIEMFKHLLAFFPMCELYSG